MAEIREITYDSELYPALLREISAPPAKLFVRGSVELLHCPGMLAVVGSRKASAYGRAAVDRLLPPLIRAGVVIVSGLAYGIDSLAHRAVVELKQPTIAVLGSGVDDASIYPRTHISLARDILKYNGAVISEYPSGTPAYQSNFPARNRIISGLTAATLLVQAAEHSGSLITARQALEANRDVGVVPGAITDPLSAGTNRLLREGAAPVLDSEDLFDLLGLSAPSRQNSTPQDLSPDQAAVFSHLSAEPLSADELAGCCQLSAAAVAVTLTELELAGIAAQTAGMKYVLSSAPFPD